MGAVESPQEKRFWLALFVGGLIAGLVLRFYLASIAQTPGHGDTAFYYTVAKNIVDGRGLVIDYVVYFLNGLEPIPHYSNDFWNPLASILLSVPMKILGKSVFSATISSMVFGTIPPVIGYLAAQRFSKSVRLAALTGILVFFAPIQIRTSVATDSIVFYGAFGATALYFTVLAFQKPYYLLSAAVGTGLAQFTRQDGVLLLIAVEISIFLMNLSRKSKAYYATSVLAIHLLVLSPFMIKNYTEFRTPFQPALSKTMFLTRYEDFHAYGIPLDWRTYRGALGLLGILKNKLDIALQNLEAIPSFLDPIITILTIMGLLNIMFRKKEQSKIQFLAPVLIFALLGYIFYTLVASFSGPGSFPKSLAILTPFSYVAVVDLLSRLKPRLLIPTWLVLVVYTAAIGFQQAYVFNTYYNELYKEYRAIKALILEDANKRNVNPQDIVVMTRNPWDVYEATDFKAVMIPNNNLKTIYYIAEIYRANYLLLPAPRRSLRPIYDGAEIDPRLELIATLPNSNRPDGDFKVFRIAPPTTAK